MCCCNILICGNKQVSIPLGQIAIFVDYIESKYGLDRTVKLKKCDYTQSFMKVNKSTLLLLYQKVELPKIREFAESVGIRVGIFDGDTPLDERNMILSNTPEVIITNFDVLHYHLWHRTKFSYLLRTSQFLFVDEAHTYTGVFGANVHHIVKRLERLCKNKLQIIAASATLPNAGIIIV